MNRPAVLVLFVAGIALGTLVYRSFTAPPPASDQASPAPSAGGEAPASRAAETAAVTPPESNQAPLAESRSATGEEGRTDAAPTRRPITLYERDSVRELIKLHVEAGLGDKGERDSSLPEPAWPVDDDSLFLKYGSFDKARTKEALISTQAILDWQNEGPFEDKALDLLPPPLLRAFELEREWLIQRLQDM